MKSMKKALNEVKKMNDILDKKEDEKLINGYKKAMSDYNETKNQHCFIAAQIIKKQIEKRGLKVDE